MSHIIFFRVQIMEVFEPPGGVDGSGGLVGDIVLPLSFSPSPVDGVDCVHFLVLLLFSSDGRPFMVST